MTGYVDPYLTERLGVQVHVTELAGDSVYLFPSDLGMLPMPRGFIDYEPQPETVKGQAVKIVQEGLADIVSWLREQGHDMPDWRVQEWDDQRNWFDGWRQDQRVSMSVINPRRDYLTVKGLS